MKLLCQSVCMEDRFAANLTKYLKIFGVTNCNKTSLESSYLVSNECKLQWSSVS